jgi:hypothetical protein
MPGLKQGEKQKLSLSRETLDGLKITGAYHTQCYITSTLLFYIISCS